MNEFTEKVREYAVSELDATERQAYLLGHRVDAAKRAGQEAIAQLTRLVSKLEGDEGPEAALSALRSYESTIGYSNSPTTALTEMNAAAGAVAVLLAAL